MPKICEFENCRKYANYGECYGKPLRCKEHKESYGLSSQLCQEINCKLRPAFNYENETKPKYCLVHKKDNMLNIISKPCIFENCKILPVFNFENETGALYCSLHKLPNMINIKNKNCNFENCKTQSNYNFDDKKNGIYCSLHKLPNMIIVTNKKCKHEKCNKSPICNYEGEKIMLYCAEHKLENMENIKSKKCEYIDCKTLPTYNYVGETTPIYCCEHKFTNMIDIKHKTCNFENCKLRPNFNYSDEKKGLYCAEHKFENMIDVTHKICDSENCKIRPHYNYSNEAIPIYCASHKLLNMIDIIGHTKCKANFCLGARANKKYKGYCANCYQHLFPLDPLSYQIKCKTKEIAVRDYINENFDGFQHDKPIYTGNCDCLHRRRIDHRILIGNTLLCIETDENQHKGYNKPDEEIRYNDLFMIHSGKFVFIRFNPDKYTNIKNKSVNPMLYTRLPILKEEIEKQIERINNEENNELLEIIKLYYDNYN
jgi:hypothetical protein